MKRRAFLALPFALAGAYGYWVSTPRIRNQGYLDLLAAEAREHLEQCQRKSLNKATNGALSPIFDGYWESTAAPGSSNDLSFLVEAMKAQSIYREPDYLNEELEPESKAERRASFQTTLSSLHPEFAKPVFLTGKVSFDTSDLNLDFLACKNLAKALSGEASALAMNGDSEGFLRCFRSILGLSRGYRAFPLLIRMTLSHSIADVALQTAIHAYSPGDQAAPWSEMARLILEAVPSREDLILCMKCEYAFGDAFYKGILEGKLPIERLAELGEELPYWKRLPGQVSREYRSYRRDASEFVAALENGQDTSALSTDVAENYHGYLRRFAVLHQFHKTAALVFETLGKGEDRSFEMSHLPNSQELSPGVEIVDGNVSFNIEDGEVDIQIVSSHWVERVGRSVVFRTGPRV